MADVLDNKALDGEYRGHLAGGDVRMQCCDACGRYRNPPRFACPSCLSRDWDWKPVSGEGVIETYVWYCAPVDPRFADVPYNVALVRLSEGPGVFANIADARMDDLAVGQRVQAVIGARRGIPQLDFVRRRNG
jgi:uncharacterized OB-fold protein